jgi:hypothetical protein
VMHSHDGCVPMRITCPADSDDDGGDRGDEVVGDE